ncbi:hypothetical protein WUBG_17777 [Wuchereria bancrofti]|uniref:Uncharacterized protein n=1 Tax=Wuchereria bancrofti TaxID=6293 RepID=J9E2Y4_WUCBA|nr:hypothetical protein WUBG_17777 [Wuchereria bancrofti]
MVLELIGTKDDKCEFEKKGDLFKDRYLFVTIVYYMHLIFTSLIQYNVYKRGGGKGDTRRLRESKAVLEAAALEMAHEDRDHRSSSTHRSYSHDRDREHNGTVSNSRRHSRSRDRDRDRERDRDSRRSVFNV